MALNNSLIRKYAKLDALHKKIMNAAKTRQCIHTLVAKKKYDKQFRQIVCVENEDAKYLYINI